MALPSQIERSAAAGRTFVNKRRRRTPRAAVVGVAMLMVVAGALTVYLLRPAKNSDTPVMLATQPTEPLALDPEPPKPKSLLDSKTKSKPAAPEPPTIRQGAAPAKPTDKPADKPTEKPAEQAVTKSSPAVAVPPPSGSPADPPKPMPVDLTGGVGHDASAGSDTTPGPASALPASSSTDNVRQLIDEGDRKLAGGDLVGARAAYNKALSDRRTVRADQDVLRAKITNVNQDLVFSSRFYKGDTLAEEYTVASGDNPSRIARRRDLTTEPGLIEQVNKVDPRKLRVGQKIKLLHGPFHAIVHKSDFRLDLYAGSPDDQAEWMFIRSFKVGLGSDNSTPVGNFVVKSGSKLVNPHWVNPRTGERFDADDPKNPIGERWIGIEGLGPAAVYTGFGLHGTIDPDSIGQQKSMGCVRLASEDVALLYDMLVDKVSMVKIEP